MSGKVICKLPKAGLGNQLFPLLKAHVFAQLNNLPIITIGYNQLKIGPWLRREKIKRRYNSYFKFQKNIFGEWLDKRKSNAIVDAIDGPIIAKISADQNNNFVFAEMPHWEDYFNGLKENRDIARDILYGLLRPGIAKELRKHQSPCIGAHIRMGDFKKLKEGEDFSKTGAKRTPEKYFIDVIQALRKIHGSTLPVSVFTDGYKHELPDLFQLESINIIEGNLDIIDMLLLSKSQVIITSAGSTFSYWSAFLSDAIVIMHPDHIHASLRPREINALFYEGPMDVENELLVKNVKAIKC